MFDKFIKKLEEELKNPLPGLEAQLKMAPPFRKKIDSMNLPDYNPKVSCVLILFYPDKDPEKNGTGKIKTVLILRPDYEGVHSAQIAFPGGKIEDTDPDFEFTALREAKEEIGIDIKKINVIGRLTELYIPPSNFLVHPIVAFTNDRPNFILDKKEVEKVIEISTEELLDETKIKIKKVRGSGSNLLLEVPTLEIQNQIIWGATAMMISELKEVLEKCF